MVRANASVGCEHSRIELVRHPRSQTWLDRMPVVLHTDEYRAWPRPAGDEFCQSSASVPTISRRLDGNVCGVAPWPTASGMYPLTSQVPVDDDPVISGWAIHGKNIYFTFSALMIFFNEPVSEIVTWKKFQRHKADGPVTRK